MAKTTKLLVLSLLILKVTSKFDFTVFLFCLLLQLEGFSLIDLIDIFLGNLSQQFDLQFMFYQQLAAATAKLTKSAQHTTKNSVINWLKLKLANALKRADPDFYGDF